MIAVIFSPGVRRDRLLSARVVGRMGGQMRQKPREMHMLPTAELHVHIEGTLEPELLVKLARCNAIAVPSTDPDELRAEYQCTSLQSFLDLYYRNVAVLPPGADFHELAAAYLARAARAGVRRAEIFFDLKQHMS